MMQVADRYNLFVVMFTGTFIVDQLFSGPIPKKLGKLEKLVVLARGRCFLLYLIYHAVINDYVQLMSRHVTVSCSFIGNNQLEGPIPSTVGHITSLEYLAIGNR